MFYQFNVVGTYMHLVYFMLNSLGEFIRAHTLTFVHDLDSKAYSNGRIIVEVFGLTDKIRVIKTNEPPSVEHIFTIPGAQFVYMIFLRDYFLLRSRYFDVLFNVETLEYRLYQSIKIIDYDHCYARNSENDAYEFMRYDGAPVIIRDIPPCPKYYCAGSDRIGIFDKVFRFIDASDATLHFAYRMPAKLLTKQNGSFYLCNAGVSIIGDRIVKVKMPEGDTSELSVGEWVALTMTADPMPFEAQCRFIDVPIEDV